MKKSKVIKSDSDSDNDSDKESHSDSDSDISTISKSKSSDTVDSTTTQSSSDRVVDKSILLDELISRQIPHLKTEVRLRYTDFKRLVKYIDTSIFDDNKCSIWKGYVTNANSEPRKASYVNFYFRNKKIALPRLLYNNFVGSIKSCEYIKYICNNRGKCCNINHMIKFKHNSCGECDDDSSDKEQLKKISKKRKTKNDNIEDKKVDKNIFCLSFK